VAEEEIVISEFCAYFGCFCVGGFVMGLLLKLVAFDPLDRHASRLERELEDVQQRPTWPSAGTMPAK
jgi:hypothetical protein